MRLSSLTSLLLLAPLAGPTSALATGSPFAGSPTAAPPSGAAEDPFLGLSVTDVYVRAEESDALVLLLFTRPEDTDSRRMRNILSSPGVSTWIRNNALAIDVDVSKARKDASDFGVAVTPVLVLTDSTRKVLERVDGVISEDDLLTTLDLSIAGRLDASRPEGDRAEDPYAWLAYANGLFLNAGNSEECAQAYFWVLDHADEHVPGMRARVLEFVLKRIAYLKQATPTAIEGLLRRRNQAQRLVVTGEGGELAVHELVRFDYWLRKELDTLDTLTRLTGLGEAQTVNQRTLLRHILKIACDHRHYDLILELVPDPIADVRTRLAAYQAQEEDPARPMPEVVHGLPDSRQQIVQDAADFYEALLSAGRGGDAEALATLVLDQLSTGRAYALFMSKAHRLRLDPLVDQLSARGLETLGPQQQRQVRQATERIRNERARQDAAEGDVDDGDDGGAPASTPEDDEDGGR